MGEFNTSEWDTMPATIKPKRAVTITAGAIRFDDFSGQEFERLCFAYLIRRYDWETLDWYGQVGSDGGRDILGVRSNDYGQQETYCFQCANHKHLRFLKIQEDIDKLCISLTQRPDKFVVLCGGKISAALREKIVKHATDSSFPNTEVWPSVELEEKIRGDTPSLLERFINGDVFPDTSNDLKLFVYDTLKKTDEEILGLLALSFDRSAFITPFYHESSLPAFKRALEDTIQVFNTGVRRTRDGHLISHIPCKHNLSTSTQVAVNDIVNKIIRLRAQFDGFVRSREIVPCACGVPNCPTFDVSQKARDTLDSIRSDILESYRLLYPKFDVKLLHL